MEKYNTKFIQACKDNNINLIKNIITNTPKNEHLYLSVIYGNIDIIQLILDTHDYFYYEIEDIFEYIYKTIELKLDNLDYIIDIYIKKFNNYDIINHIRPIFSKEFNLIDWYFGLLNKYNLSYNKFIDNDNLINIISSSNNNDLIKLSNYISLDKLNYQRAFNDACLTGNLDAVKFLYNLTNDLNLLSYKSLYHSCYKDFDLVKWLIETNPNLDLTLENYKPFRLACYRGKYDIAKYLYDKNPEVIDKLKDSFEICERMVLDSLYNSLELCKWLYSFNIYEFDIESLYDILVDGNLNVEKLEWLYSVIPEFINNHRYIIIFNHSWFNGLECAKWLYNKRPDIDIYNDNYCLFIDSCNHNKKDIIDWLLSLRPQIFDNTNTFNKILKNIIKNNCRYIDNFIWLFEILYKETIPSNIDKLIRTSMKDSTIEIYQYLIFRYAEGTFGDKEFKINLDDFTNICKKNSINFIKLIYNNHEYIKDLINTEYITNLFNDILKSNSCITITKWLYNNFPIIVINNLTIHNAFLSNNRRTIKWILSLQNDYNLCYNNNIILNDLCKSEFLDFHIVKYLFRLDRYINLRVDNDILLKTCFRLDDYYMAIWLLKKIGIIELDSSYDQYFRDKCRENHYKFVKLMNKLNPDRYKYNIAKDGDLTAKISRYVYKTKDIKIDDLCMICLTNKSDIITQCEHIYCYNCIDIWLNINENCPYCRTNITELYKINQ